MKEMARDMIDKIEDNEVSDERKIGMISWIMEYLDNKLSEIDETHENYKR